MALSTEAAVRNEANLSGEAVQLARERWLKGWFWLGAAYPMQGYAGRFDLRHVVYQHYDFTRNLVEQAKAISEEGRFDIAVERIVPRRREGGAYVQLLVKQPERKIESLERPDAAHRETDQVVEEPVMAPSLPLMGPVEKRHEMAHLGAAYEELGERLHRLKLRVPLSGHDCKLYPVLGRPWVDDLSVPYPYSSITLHLHGSECKKILQEPTLEQKLWEIFRPYGHIQKITLETPRAPKDGGTFSTEIRFSRLSSAIAARACLNRADINSLLYNIERHAQGKLFPASERKHMIHLPLSATVSAASLGGPDLMSVLYVPFVATNVITSFATKHSRIFVVLVGLSLALLTYTVVEPLRRSMVWLRFSRILELSDNEQLQWLSQQFSNTRLSGLVPGGNLAGKSAKAVDTSMIEQYLKKPPGTIMYVTGAAGTGKSLLAQSIFRTGQVRNSLYLNLANELSLPPEEFVYQLAKKVGYFPTFRSIEWMASLADAITPGAGKATVSSTKLNEERILQSLTIVVRRLAKGHQSSSGPPLPLIIIDGCTDMNKRLQNGFMLKLLAWADVQAQAGRARVIFFADSTFEASGGISAVLPHAKVDKLVMKDVPLETSVEILEAELGYVDEDTVAAARAVGGRFTDLSILLNKLKRGATPAEALAQMVESAADDLRSVLFEHTGDNPGFSTAQLWRMVKLLAKEEEVLYNHALFSIFKGNDQALRSLLLSQLFTIIPAAGGKDTIRAGSPLLQVMFEAVQDDVLLLSGMDLQLTNASLSSDVSLVRELEAELTQIQLSHNTSTAARARVSFLENQIQQAQQRIQANDDLRIALEATIKNHSKPCLTK